MGVINESRSVAVTQLGGQSIEAEIQVRGFRSRADGSGFGYERHTPQVVTVRRGEQETKHTNVLVDGPAIPAFAAPLALYAVVRIAMTIRRRSQ